MLLFSLLSLTQVPAPAVYVSPRAPSNALSCLPAGISRGAKVVALGVYSSSTGKSMPFMLAGSPYPVHVLNVVGSGKDPIVLVVAAYEPILWDLSAIGDRVKAVVASGYYPQAVRGISRDVPVRFSSSVGSFSGSETCARIHYAYDDLNDIQTMAGDVRRAIGVYPRIFYGSYSTDRMNVDGAGSAISDLPDLSEIRTSVPLITEDDPASTAKMKMIPSPDESSGGPRLRVVEWNDSGKVIRDEGGKPQVASRSQGSVWSPDPSEQHGAYRPSVLRWLFWIAIGFFAIRWWWRSKKRSGDRAAQPPSQRTNGDAPVAQPASEPPSAVTAMQRQIAELSALAAITDSEPLVMALHRYGREVQNLSRIKLDPDLGDEASAIVGRHFEHAIERYRQVRGSLAGAEGERADAMLTGAIERLVVSLQELQAAQHGRDVDGVDEAARFIVARHPT